MTEARAPAPSAISPATVLVPWLLALGLLAMVLYLASERNERLWRLSVDHGQVSVQRGRFFPIGVRTLGSGDGPYAPLMLPAGAKVPAGDDEFQSQTALDQALFARLLPVAQGAASAGKDPAATKQAEELAARLSQLPGLTAQQLSQLAEVRGGLAFSEAQAHLREAYRELLAGRERLAVTRQGGGPRAVEAAEIDAALTALTAALGRALQEPGAARAAPIDAGAQTHAR